MSVLGLFMLACTNQMVDDGTGDTYPGGKADGECPATGIVCSAECPDTDELNGVPCEFGFFDHDACECLEEQPPFPGTDEYLLAVTVGEGMGATMTVVYQSTRDTILCTDRGTDEGGGSVRVPEQFRRAVDPSYLVDDNTGETVLSFAVKHKAGDRCDSVVRHIYLEPSNDRLSMEPWASLAFVDSFEYQNEVQDIACNAIRADTMFCGNDLLYYDYQGRSSVRLALE